jgi:hypothetical protein
MAPERSPSTSQGEKLAALAASFEGFERYNHERWHQLNNDLQPLIGLPVQMARDIAKLEGKIEAKMDGRLLAIENRLTAIEGQRRELTGAQKLTVWIIQTIISALAVLVAIRGGLR